MVAASAGGVEALRSLLGGPPGDLRAAVLVVLHISPRAGSALPGILDRSGPLKAAAAQDGEPLRHGHVYVAPPDLHLLLDGGEGEAVDRELERELSPFYSAGALPRPPGDLSALTCPDCNGPLYEVPTSPNGYYQCVVGHAWSLESMIDGQGEAVERAFWVTILRLEERQHLMTRMLSTAQRHGETVTARWLRRQVEQDRDTVKALRRLQSQSGWEAPVAVTEGDRRR